MNTPAGRPKWRPRVRACSAVMARSPRRIIGPRVRCEPVLKGGVASGGFIHQDKVRVQFQSQREGLGFAGVEALVPAERGRDAIDRPGLE